jgi:hypothetical protein
MKQFLALISIVVLGCGGARAPVQQPSPPSAAPEIAPETAPAPALKCDERQVAISRDADTRAAPWSVAQHLSKNFPDGRVAWLMPDAKYQEFVVKPAAKKWGRCNDTGCYVFVAPIAVIQDAVKQSMIDGRHDAAALGKALGLPAASFQGTLRMMTHDLGKTGTCARLPVDEDPGVWKCKTAEETDCFKFGGYTSGGIPELIVIDAPIDQTAIEEVP